MIFEIDDDDKKRLKVVVSRSSDKRVIGYFVKGLENRIWFHTNSNFCFTDRYIEYFPEWFEKAESLLNSKIYVDFLGR